MEGISHTVPKTVLASSWMRSYSPSVNITSGPATYKTSYRPVALDKTLSTSQKRHSISNGTDMSEIKPLYIYLRGKAGSSQHIQMLYEILSGGLVLHSSGSQGFSIELCEFFEAGCTGVWYVG